MYSYGPLHMAVQKQSGQQLCEDTGCNPGDLLETMNNRERWRERARDIHADGTTRWWSLHVRCLILDGTVLSVPTRGISRKANNDMTNTIISHIHFYKDLEEGQEKVNFMEVKNFIWNMSKNWLKKSVKGVLECSYYIPRWSCLI